MDERGYLTLRDRSKDVVISGGSNIYPREVEEFLYTHPDIVDAQVIGVPDERYGEELCAWIIKNAGAEVSEARAQSDYHKALADYDRQLGVTLEKLHISIDPPK